MSSGELSLNTPPHSADVYVPFQAALSFFFLSFRLFSQATYIVVWMERKVE